MTTNSKINLWSSGSCSISVLHVSGLLFTCGSSLVAASECCYEQVVVHTQLKCHVSHRKSYVCSCVLQLAIDGFHGIFSLGNWRALHHHAACWLVNILITWHFCSPVSMVKDAMESVYTSTSRSSPTKNNASLREAWPRNCFAICDHGSRLKMWSWCSPVSFPDPFRERG